MDKFSQLDFVGREPELVQLRNVFREGPGGHIVLISGPCGIGKTFLVQHLLKDLSINKLWLNCFNYSAQSENTDPTESKKFPFNPTKVSETLQNVKPDCVILDDLNLDSEVYRDILRDFVDVGKPLQFKFNLFILTREIDLFKYGDMFKPDIQLELQPFTLKETMELASNKLDESSCTQLHNICEGDPLLLSQMVEAIKSKFDWDFGKYLKAYKSIMESEHQANTIPPSGPKANVFKGLCQILAYFDTKYEADITFVLNVLRHYLSSEELSLESVQRGIKKYKFIQLVQGDKVEIDWCGQSKVRCGFITDLNVDVAEMLKKVVDACLASIPTLSSPHSDTSCLMHTVSVWNYFCNHKYRGLDVTGILAQVQKVLTKGKIQFSVKPPHHHLRLFVQEGSQGSHTHFSEDVSDMDIQSSSEVDTSVDMGPAKKEVQHDTMTEPILKVKHSHPSKGLTDDWRFQGDDFRMDNALAQLADSIIPPPEYIEEGSQVVNKVFELLKKKSRFKVDHLYFEDSVKTGCIAFSDFDCIVYLNGDSAIRKVLDEFVDILKMSSESLTIHPDSIRSGEWSVQFKSRGGFSVDLLPAAIRVDPYPLLTLRYPRSLSEVFLAPLVEAQDNFMNEQSSFVHQFVRLAKFWYWSLYLGKDIYVVNFIIKVIACTAIYEASHTSMTVTFKKFLTYVTDIRHFEIKHGAIYEKLMRTAFSRTKFIEDLVHSLSPSVVIGLHLFSIITLDRLDEMRPTFTDDKLIYDWPLVELFNLSSTILPPRVIEKFSHLAPIQYMCTIVDYNSANPDMAINGKLDPAFYKVLDVYQRLIITTIHSMVPIKSQPDPTEVRYEVMRMIHRNMRAFFSDGKPVEDGDHKDFDVTFTFPLRTGQKSSGTAIRFSMRWDTGPSASPSSLDVTKDVQDISKLKLTSSYHTEEAESKKPYLSGSDTDKKTFVTVSQVVHILVLDPVLIMNVRKLSDGLALPIPDGMLITGCVPVSDVFRQIVTTWVYRNGENATIKELTKVLEQQGLRNVSQMLHRFGPSAQIVSW